MRDSIQLVMHTDWSFDYKLYPGKASPGRSSDRGCTVVTTYWEDIIWRIGYESASTIVEINLTWSLGLVLVEPGSVEARISLIKVEFSSCLFADSLINLLKKVRYAVSNVIGFTISVYRPE
uniref:Uncharacterized protein n=1 Tax=Tanacetum cinerariifolium TaxID=118510 RepID=A0A6L2P5V8_TANCI|nr:hypothetical protein [Tanacetum cinerariifolium]